MVRIFQDFSVLSHMPVISKVPKLKTITSLAVELCSTASAARYVSLLKISFR